MDGSWPNIGLVRIRYGTCRGRAVRRGQGQSSASTAVRAQTHLVEDLPRLLLVKHGARAVAPRLALHLVAQAVEVERLGRIARRRRDLLPQLLELDVLGRRVLHGREKETTSVATPMIGASEEAKRGGLTAESMMWSRKNRSRSLGSVRAQIGMKLASRGALGSYVYAGVAAESAATGAMAAAAATAMASSGLAEPNVDSPASATSAR